MVGLRARDLPLAVRQHHRRAELSVFAVAVAACPPLALLLAVELLNRALKRHRAETASETGTETGETGD